MFQLSKIQPILGFEVLWYQTLPELWWEGPSWLTNSRDGLNQTVIQPSLESQKQAKLEKQIVVNTIKITHNAFDKLLEKCELHKALKVSARVNRFIKNCHHSKLSGPLTTSEIEKKITFDIKGERTKKIREQWKLSTVL